MIRQTRAINSIVLIAFASISLASSNLDEDSKAPAGRPVGNRSNTSCGYVITLRLVASRKAYSGFLRDQKGTIMRPIYIRRNCKPQQVCYPCNSPKSSCGPQNSLRVTHATPKIFMLHPKLVAVTSFGYPGNKGKSSCCQFCYMSSRM